jgi:pyruvate dehydrogenase E2 component (dihydrolipoamide acetyltransferase)
MAESARTAAAVTLTTEADATELVELRERQKAVLTPRGAAVPTYNDLFIKLVAAALGAHPRLNGYWQDDQLVLQAGIHIGMAVDAEAGLVVPVLRDVPSKGASQLAEESRALVEKARTGRLEPDEMQGGTFTVTNLGAYGVDAFTPIINLPQCAILGIGRIIKKPGVFEDRVVPRSMVALSLTFDHRAVDGGPAARFLDTVRQYAEQPYLWL